VWWTAPGLEKIRPFDPPPEQPNHEINISAARNEFEPFQVILRSDDADVESVDIDVTDLRGPGSLTLS
jgi:hypothetical protein